MADTTERRSSISLFRALRNPRFARLYLAQTISLFGDSLTWVALALVSVDLAGRNAPLVLGGALTMRVLAFALLSPLAGALADRVNRKLVLVLADAGRVVLVGLLALATQGWQVQILLLLVNAFTAFFTPTYQAVIPSVAGGEYEQAISLSGATQELLGVLGPGIAGGLAVLFGAQGLFLLDAASFLASGLLVLSLPSAVFATSRSEEELRMGNTWRDVTDGTGRLFRDGTIRYVLMLEFAAAVSGAIVLVNTVGYVREVLGAPESAYGAVMAAFGIGATMAAVVVGMIGRRIARTTQVLTGSLLSAVAIIAGGASPLLGLGALWVLAGAGQNLVNLPTQTLIADRIPQEAQGRVYGAHFAWSHLWWAAAYPLAAWLGARDLQASFWLGGMIAIAATGLAWLTRPRTAERQSSSTA